MVINYLPTGMILQVGGEPSPVASLPLNSKSCFGGVTLDPEVVTENSILRICKYIDIQIKIIKTI